MMLPTRADRCRAVSALAVLAGCAGMLASALAAAQPAHWVNQYGQVGLMQTPTARSLGKGALGTGIGLFSPYRTVFMHVQPLDWIQGNIRYFDISNRDYSYVAGRPPDENPQSVSRRFTDKGVDLQIRLWKESRWLPAVSLGLMDIAGTGLLGSEYIVASRRYHDFDVHFGVGWGRLGSGDDIDNPFGMFADRFDERPAAGSGLGGQLEPQTYFRGATAFFGGIVWTPGGGPLSLFAEVEGNDYQSEPLDNPQDVDSRVNIGASYRLFDAIDIGVGWQRGNEFAAQVSMAGNLEYDAGPENVLQSMPAPVPAYPSMMRAPIDNPLDHAVVERIRRDMRRQGLRLHALDADADDSVLTAWYSQTLGHSIPQAAGRAARAVLRNAGVTYDRFVMVEMVGGTEAVRVTMPSEAFHRAAGGDWTADEFAEFVRVLPTSARGYRGAAYRDLLRYPSLSTAFNPQFRSNIGGPDAFVVGQILARLSATVQLTPGWSVSGALGVNVADNIGNRLQQRFPSGLPPVRSNVGDYLREGKDFYLAQLETNYLFPIVSDVYGRVSAGIFEEMFGGVAGEVLYRPSGARWALGADVARVRQRDFEQRFGFQDYEVTTGHLTYYHELPWQDLRVVLSAGRYLAGDIGGTLDISREFASGVRFGVFATRTDASTEEFGEGSFDKGFYLSIPIGLFSPAGGRGEAEFLYRPLTRDGGQKVRAGRALYDALDLSTSRSVYQGSARDWLR